MRNRLVSLACQHIIRRRKYFQDESLLDKAYENSQALARKLQSFRKSISSYKVKEDAPLYGENDL